MNADRINEHYYGDPSSPTTRRARERIHWICGQAKGRRVLDVGCSQGIASLILGREGFDCTGIDIEAASLAVAQAALAKEDGIVQRRVTFRNADASRLPFDDGAFDTVILGEILEHLTHPDRVLSEAKRVLQTGGRLVLTVPHGLNPYHDHKCSYYPVALLEVLEPHFRTTTIETTSHFILYTGEKDAAHPPEQHHKEVDLATYLRLGKALESRCLDKERLLLEAGAKLQAQSKAVSEEASNLQKRVGELETLLKVRDEQLHEQERNQKTAREAAANLKDAAAQTAVRHRTQLEELQAKMGRQTEAMTVLRKHLDEKTAQMEKLKTSLEQARSSAETARELMRQDLTAKETRLREMGDHLDQARRNLERLQDSSAMTQKAQADREAALSAQREQATARLQELERSAREKDLELRELREQHHVLRQEALSLREAMLRQEAARLDTVTRLEAQAHERESKIVNLEQNVVAQSAQMKSLEERRASLERELSELKRNSAAHDDVWQEKLKQVEARLTRDLRAKESQLKDLAALHAARLKDREEEQREALASREADWHRRLTNQRIREIARACLPRDAKVLVISKGDDDLLQLDGRSGEHFPQTLNGVYAGHHPADSQEAIEDIQKLQAAGAHYLLIPASSFWWLDYYAGFREHLESQHRLVAYEETTCAIYALTPRADDRPCWMSVGVRKNGAPDPQRPAPELPVRSGPTPPAKAPNPPVEPKRSGQQPHLGVILDEFTTGCLESECRLTTFTPENWSQTLERERPDALFVESAWRGNKGSWRFRVASYERVNGQDLADVVQWAHDHSIPSIFWNKEDPVHFEKFVDRAGLFSHVFTTDADSIARYRDKLGHERVFALPFAAQPALHNPIQGLPRSGAVCFAGTYYGNRHEQRRADMDYILRPAIPFGLEIYDRQYGMTGMGAEAYRFPEPYSACIRGRLDYEDMVRAYKYYRVFLNVNSVKHSPTMFSRRVFELLACGTPVISTYSRGIIELLGEDLVFITESEADTQKHLERLLGDEDAWALASARGIREVMRAHTYQHRLQEVFQQVGLPALPVQHPKISVILPIESARGIEALAAALKTQTYRHFDVILISPSAIPTRHLEYFEQASGETRVASLVGTPAKVYEDCLRTTPSPYFAFMNPEDFYGPDYLLDLALTRTYAPGPFAGKHTYSAIGPSGEKILLQSGQEFKYVASVPSSTLMADKSVLSQRDFESICRWTAFCPPNTRILSIDRFSYVQGACRQQLTEALAR